MNYALAVTSGTRKTGKTTSAIALGSVFADAGCNVLLIDFDVGSPSLAEAIGLSPTTTIRDVFFGESNLRSATYPGPSGVSIVPGEQFKTSDPQIFTAFVENIDDFDIIICDTGHPFSDATRGVCNAADGIIVMSTPRGVPQKNTAAIHQSLRERGLPLLGTVLTRVSADEIGDDWRCELLATIPESDGVVTSLPLTLDSLSESVAIKYNDLTEDIAELLKSRSNTQSSDLWLSQPPDPFISPNSVSLSRDQQKNVSALSEDVTDGTVEAPTATGVATNQTSIIDSVGSENSDTEGNIALSRRGVLAAITATIGGITAGILNQRETIDIESFGYGGTPTSSNHSATEKKVNKTTNITSPPTEDITRTTDRTGTNSTDGTGNNSSDSSPSDEIVQEENGSNDSNETEEERENKENNKKPEEGSEEPAYFSISESQINSPITEGDPLVIQSTITNSGRESTEQTVTAEIPRVGSDSKTVSLSGGSSITERFRIPTKSGHAGSYEAIVTIRL